MAGPAYNDSGCTGSAPLVLGAARGRRSFYLDAEGVLRGVTYRWPWRDGENVAECMVTDVRNPMATRGSHNWGAQGWGVTRAPYVMGGVVFGGDPDGPPTPAEGYQWARCEGLDPTCACGFYAYHDSMSAYATSGPGCRVQGIIEGYGKVILGTQGYRAEKARILALAVPPPSAAARRRAELERTMRDIEESLDVVRDGLRTPWWKQSLILAYGGLALVAAGFAAVPAYRAGALMVAGYCAANARIAYLAIRKQLQAMRESLVSDLETCGDSLVGLPENYEGHVEKCRGRYPGVKFFASAEEMYAAYPVTSLRHLAVPEGPVPEETGE